MHEKGRTSLPADNRQVVTVRSPRQTFLLLTEPLELHRELTFRDLVIGESLEMAGETELRGGPDEPFGGIILIPLDCVTVVHGELVMEVVVPLTDGDESGDHVVAGSVLVVKRSVAKPVRKGVYTEGRLHGD